MKVWITKHALTKGIAWAAVEPSESRPGMVKYYGGTYPAYYRKNEWHETREAAVNRVLQMIAAKRKSIAKQLAKLDKLESELMKSK